MKSLTEEPQTESQVPAVLTKQQVQALQWREQSTALVSILKDAKVEIDKVIEIEQGLTIQRTLESVPICVQIKQHGRKDVAVSLDLQLVRLSKMMNVKHNLSDAMISTIVYDLIEKFKDETMEDFILVFKRMRQGYYGPSYHLLSEASIMECMALHLEEKWTEKERQLADEKHKQSVIEKKLLDEEQIAEGYKRLLKEGVKALDVNKKKEEDDDYQQFRANYYRKQLLDEQTVEGQKQALAKLDGNKTEG